MTYWWQGFSINQPKTSHLENPALLLTEPLISHKYFHSLHLIMIFCFTIEHGLPFFMIKLLCMGKL